MVSISTTKRPKRREKCVEGTVTDVFGLFDNKKWDLNVNWSRNLPTNSASLGSNTWEVFEASWNWNIDTKDFYVLKLNQFLIKCTKYFLLTAGKAGSAKEYKLLPPKQNEATRNYLIQLFCQLFHSSET